MKRIFQKRELFVFSMVAMDTILVTLIYVIAYILRSRLSLFGQAPIYLDQISYRLIYPVLSSVAKMNSLEKIKRWPSGILREVFSEKLKI